MNKLFFFEESNFILMKLNKILKMTLTPINVTFTELITRVHYFSKPSLSWRCNFKTEYLVSFYYCRNDKNEADQR